MKRKGLSTVTPSFPTSASIFFCLLLLLLGCTYRGLGAPPGAPPGASDPWSLEIPSDEELLSSLSDIEAPSLPATLLGGPSGGPLGFRCRQQMKQIQVAPLLPGGPRLPRIPLLRCCLSDFAQHRRLMEEALSLGGPLLGAAEEGSQGAPVYFEVLKGLMEAHDVLQVQLIGRELLRLKQEAAKRDISLSSVSYMLPALLQWWEWFKNKRDRAPNLRGPPPLRISRRRPFCSSGPLNRSWLTSRLASHRGSQLAIPLEELVLALLSPGGPQGRLQPPAGICPFVSFPWAQLLGAAAAAGGPYEVMVREGAPLAAQRALEAAQLTTKLELYEAHAAATATAAAGAGSPLLARLKETLEGGGPLGGPLRGPEDLKERLREGKERRQMAFAAAKSLAAEAQQIQKRHLSLKRIDALDVCLASLAAIN